MNKSLELGTLLALVGVPLACCTWLADAVTLPKQALFTVAATLTVTSWLVGWRQGLWPLGRRGLWTGLAAAPFLWSLVGTTVAGWPEEGLSDAGLAIGLALVGLAWNATLNETRARRWTGYVIGTAAVLATYSWLQRLGLDPIGWNFPHLSRERTIATLGNPDFLALYLVVAAPLALERIAGWRGPVRLVGLGAWLLGCQALILTTTRGSWLAGLAAAAVWLWFQRRSPRLTLGLAVALLLMLGATGVVQRSQTSGYSVTQRVRSLGNLQENSFTARLYLWYSASRLGQRAPLWGQGWGTFPYLALEFRDHEPMELRILQRIPEDPHSQYFLWLAVGGYPALGLWLMALWAFARRAPSPGAASAGVALGVNLLFLSCTLEASLVWMLLFSWAASLAPPRGQREPSGGPWGVVLVVLLAAGASWWSGRALLAEREIWWGDDYELQGDLVRADDHFALAEELAGPGQRIVAVERRGRLRLTLLQRLGVKPEVADQAQEFYREACRLSPLNPYPLASLARVNGLWTRVDPARLESAERYWREALARDPRNPRFWAEFGLLYANHGRFAEALECLNKSLEIYPSLTEFQLHKAHILVDLGRHAEASSLLDEIEAREPASSQDVKALRERLRR